MADLDKDAAAGKLAPVYVVGGSEPLLVERAVAAVRDAAVPEAVRGFNLDIIEGRAATADRVLGAAQTLPMMAARRMVLVRDAHQIPAAELTKLVPYLSAPNPSSVLMLVFGKLDKRTKFVAAAKKHRFLHELAAPRNLSPWLREELARRQVAMRPAAQARLLDVVGANLARLAVAIDQLSLYAGDRAVEVDDVDDLIADTRERTVFELTDAIGAGDRPRALAATRALFEQRQSAIGVVVMLARHLRQLGLCHAATDERLPRPEIARAVGVPPFVVDKLMAQARRVSAAEVARGLARVADADRALKGMAPMMKTLGRGLGERVVIDRLVAELCALGERRPRR